MKKILLIISVLVMSSGCCLNCGVEAEGFLYELRNDSASGGYTYINMVTAYPLPEHRTKDFLGTMILLMTAPELDNDVRVNIEHIESNDISLFYSPFNYGVGVTVKTNNNYSSSVVDPKDVNYYEKVITYDEILLDVYREIQIYLRQDLEPTTAISYMIMTKPLNGANYEYVGHAYLNQLNIKPAAGLRKPLPDILK